MKNTLAVLLAAATTVAVAQGTAEAPKKDMPKDITTKDVETISMLMGYQLGSSMVRQSPGMAHLKDEEFNMNSFRKGMLAGMQGSSPTDLNLKDEEIQKTFESVDAVLNARLEELGKANAEVSKKFIEENKKKDGVITTPSGLQYTVISKGGDKKFDEKAYKNPLFTVKYKGTTVDGEVFDQSPEGETVDFPLQLIPGFTEALKIMPIGAKWKLFIPAELAYAEQSPTPKIKPNSALIFELELVGIKEGPEQDAGEGMQISPEMLQQMLKEQQGQQ